MPLQKVYSFGLILSARIAGAASLFAVNLLIVHYLGFEALATYAVFVSLVSITAVVMSAGFTAIAPVFVAEYAKKKQPELLKGFTRTALRQGSLLLALLAAVLLLIPWLGNRMLFIDNLELAAAVLITSAATAVLGFNSAVLVGMKKQISALIPETFMRPVIFLTLSGIFFAAGIVTSIYEVLWLLAFSVWLTFALVLIRDRKMHRDFSTIRQMKERIRWRNASLPWMGITLLWDFMIDLVLLLTSILAGSIEIAILHICFRYRVLAGFGMRTIYTLLMPEITEHAVEGNREGVSHKLFQVNLASLVYSIAVMICFAVLGKMLLGLFSPEAVVGVPILLLVSTTMLIRAVFGPAPLVLAVHNFHMITLIVSLVCMIGAVAFIGASFDYFGVMAAAIGYTGANLMISSILWYLAKKKTGIDCSIFARLLHNSKLDKSCNSMPT